MRLRIDLAYDGGDFHGWAVQPGLRTVQAELAAALATALRIPPDDPAERVEMVVAGRTDAGVHARGQVCHVDVDDARMARSAADGPARLVRRLNGLLPPDVRVRTVAEAAPGFDARYSALWRRYAYRVSDRPTTSDPLRRGWVLSWPRELDTELMHQTAQTLVGRHDFASFCKRRVGATTIRTLLDLDVTRDAEGLLEVGVRADAFCHSMVRSLVGCLIAVGEGRQVASWATGQLATRRRDPALTVARARGLTLEEVAYPADADLAQRASVTRATRQEHEATGERVEP